MKRIGLLGGLTWHSTATYYAQINQGVADRLGAFQSADIAMRSVNYDIVRQCREHGDWRVLQRAVVDAARDLQRAGADGIFICSNTIHRFADAISSQVNLEIVHVADAIAAHAKREGFGALALFGTAYTVTERFYIDRLASHGLTILTPDPDAVAAMDHIILEELAQGEMRDESRAVFVHAMAKLQAQGAEAMVLGCTEIGMIVGAEDIDVPVLDSTLVHAEHAVDWALQG